jgi:hypothetical protein
MLGGRTMACRDGRTLRRRESSSLFKNIFSFISAAFQRSDSSFSFDFFLFLILLLLANYSLIPFIGFFAPLKRTDRPVMIARSNFLSMLNDTMASIEQINFLPPEAGKEQ